MARRFEQRLARVGRWVLAGAFFAMPLNGLRPGSGLSYGDVLFLAAFGIAVLLVLVRRQLPKIPLWLWVGAALLLASALVVQAFPPASLARLEASFPDVLHGSPLLACSKLLVGVAFFPSVAATILRDWQSISLPVSAWIAGVAFSCVTAVSDAYVGTGFQLAFTYDLASVVGFFAIEPARSFGLTLNPNALGMTCVMATPLVLARMTSVRRVLSYYPIFLLFLVAILLGGARTALVGITLAVVLTLAFTPSVRRTLLSHDYRVALTLFGGLVATIAVVLGLAIQPSDRALEYYVARPAVPDARLLASGPGDSSVAALLAAQNGTDSGPPTIRRFGAGDDSAAASDKTRKQYFEDSVRYIGERPLIGYGFRWIETSHNIYLQLLLSGGILALVGFLVIATGYLRMGYRLRLLVPESIEATASAATVSFALMLVIGLVGNWIVDRYLYLPVALIFAMSMIAIRIRDSTGIGFVDPSLRAGTNETVATGHHQGQPLSARRNGNSHVADAELTRAHRQAQKSGSGK